MTNTYCELPIVSADDREIVRILRETKTIAVVGISHKPERDSHKVAMYLIQKGFRVVPVNPIRDEILGQKCYRSLLDIPFPVDMADLFLTPEKVSVVVDEAIQKGVKTIWMQIGVINNEAAQKAMEHGISVIMNMCVMREYERLKALIERPDEVP